MRPSISRRDLESRADAVIETLRSKGANLGVGSGREALDLGLELLESRGIIVVEQNHGAQLYHYLLGQKAIPPAAESVARPGPLPYRPSEIASYVA